MIRSHDVTSRYVPACLHTTSDHTSCYVMWTTCFSLLQLLNKLTRMEQVWSIIFKIIFVYEINQSNNVDELLVPLSFIMLVLYKFIN